MNDIQKKVVKLLDNAEPKKNLKKWLRGYIPKNYKRLTIDMEEAKELATLGASTFFAYFGETLYFTQSLIVGAVLSNKYKKITAVTNSQYGKSFTLGGLAVILGDMGKEVNVAGGNKDTADIIMGKVIQHLQNVDESVKEKMLETVDKIEKLQTATAKDKVAFKGGGKIQSITLGVTSKDSKKGNAAIGKSGIFMIDEASFIPEDVHAEMGRREFSSVDGKKELMIQISNPHNPGKFYDDLTTTELLEDELIIWMDIRTAFEENRVKSKEQVINSEFFKVKMTCQQYLLCELEDYSESSMFGELQIDDSPPAKDDVYFIGADSAYKGKDDIIVFVGSSNKSGIVRLLDCKKINKGEWEDGVTGEKITNEIASIIVALNASSVCADIGFGIWLVEGLAKRFNKTKHSIYGINFGEGTTKVRKKANHYASVYGANMRAELHIDLQQLIESKKITATSKMAKVLKPQMSVVRQIIKSGAKIQIISKDEIKTILGYSPDELDSALLMIHSVILHSMNGGYFINKGGE